MKSLFCIFDIYAILLFTSSLLGAIVMTVMFFVQSGYHKVSVAVCLSLIHIFFISRQPPPAPRPAASPVPPVQSAGRRKGAVSYTHLDVYKRQDQLCQLHPARAALREDVRQGVGHPHLVETAGHLGHLAVKVAGKDVYKRQAISSAPTPSPHFRPLSKSATACRCRQTCCWAILWPFLTPAGRRRWPPSSEVVPAASWRRWSLSLIHIYSSSSGGGQRRPPLFLPV